MGLPIYLYVTPFFPEPGRHFGNYCLDAVKAIIRTGRFDVHVFVPETNFRVGRIQNEYVVDGVTVHRFTAWRCPTGIFPFLFRTRNERSFIGAVEKAGIELRNVRICHGHTAPFAIYPIALKKIVPSCLALLHHHDPASFGLNHGRAKWPWIYRVILYLQLRSLHEQIDCHVFISELTRHSFCSVPSADWSCYETYRRQMRGLGWLRGVRCKRTLICHNGVDGTLFRRTAAGEIKNKKVGLNIGAVGNFWDWKDFPALIDAFVKVHHNVPDARLSIVGHGPEEPKMLDMINKFGVSDAVEIIREMPHDQMAAFYRTLDLFVLPSYFEGFGCVFTEAWACGTPFISTTHSGAVDMIETADLDKWTCAPKRSDELARLILNYYLNRPVQKLKCEVDIDVITREFLDQLQNIK